MRGSFKIADWQVDPEINCLQKDEKILHLEPKVMQVLVQLSLHPKEVLSKERLIQAVWPDTFVSDDVLTRSISVLRRLLDDDPHNPKFIQTIPKAGYRLLVDPQPLESATITHESEVNRATAVAALKTGESSEVVTVIAPPEQEEASETSAEETRPKIRNRWRERWLIPALLVLVCLIAVLSLVLWWTITHQKTPVTAVAFRTVSFTSYEGQQSQPAFSPDGNQIVFVWDGRRNDTRDLYIKQIGNEALHRLTSDDAYEFSPVWSPDGSQIAYFSASDSDQGIYLISSLGGTPRKIYSPSPAIVWDLAALSWSPDGKSLIFPYGKSAQHPSSIYRLSLDTLQIGILTHPPSNWEGDVSPAFSPDGKQIAFVRATEGAVRDIYVISSDHEIPPKRITFDNRNIKSLAWDNDGRSIVFSSDRGGKYSLWRVPSTGGEPQRLPVGTDDATEPAISRTTQRLAYTQSSAVWSILKFQLRSSTGDPKATAVVSSTQQDSAPACSPDGTHIAFQSWRSGSQEIWVSSKDGSNLVRITSFERSLSGSPAWSPDGKQIAFDSRPEGRSHIYVTPAGGGVPRQITSGNYNDILPRWSRDGRFLYFSSNRNDSWQIWKISTSGGTPQQITTGGGFIAAESFDGKWLYYTKPDVSGIWRIPASGGPEIRILDQPKVGYWGYWNLSRSGLYFLSFAQDKPTINLLNLTTSRSSKIITLDRRPPVYSGLSLCTDESALLLTDQNDAESHITLVESSR